VNEVLVLGSTGMLGSAVLVELRRAGLQAIPASRSVGHRFDALDLKLEELMKEAKLGSDDFVVNCIGLTKARIDESSLESRQLAVRLNVDFPNALAKTAEERGVRVIQVATDCVYSGALGNYSEKSPHDPHDVYGKTKSLGESPSANVMHLRCSLIGPELGRASLFFEWVRQQPPGSLIEGYTNHLWNGITSKAFGQVVSGVLVEGLFAAGVQHLVPDDAVTKDQLVRSVLKELGRSDVRVTSVSAPERVDRTLSTVSPDRNLAFFKAAGFKNHPSIQRMVHEMCQELAN
jgi:dTDP-4-dehydrorhamnose reductase